MSRAVNDADLLPLRCQIDLLELDLGIIYISVETCDLDVNDNGVK
jgi:hypothetical protein